LLSFELILTVNDWRRSWSSAPDGCRPRSRLFLLRPGTGLCWRLQLLSEPLDTRKLQLFTGLTKELVAFIDLDRAATAQKVRDATSSRSSRANSTG